LQSGNDESSGHEIGVLTCTHDLWLLSSWSDIGYKNIRP
jgi:hypothetical protein